MLRNELLNKVNGLIIRKELLNTNKFKELINKKVADIMNLYWYLYGNEILENDSNYQFLHVDVVEYEVKRMSATVSTNIDINNLKDSWYYEGFGIYYSCNDEEVEELVYNQYMNLLSDIVLGLYFKFENGNIIECKEEDIKIYSMLNALG